MKRKTLGAVRATLLLVLSRLDSANLRQVHTPTLIRLVEKTGELARLVRRLPTRTDHRA